MGEKVVSGGGSSCDSGDSSCESGGSSCDGSGGNCGFNFYFRTKLLVVTMAQRGTIVLVDVIVVAVANSTSVVHSALVGMQGGWLVLANFSVKRVVNGRVIIVYVATEVVVVVSKVIVDGEVVVVVGIIVVGLFDALEFCVDGLESLLETYVVSLTTIHLAPRLPYRFEKERKVLLCHSFT